MGPELKNNIHKFALPEESVIKLEGAKFPSDLEFNFYAKRAEIYNLYCKARLCLRNSKDCSQEALDVLSIENTTDAMINIWSRSIFYECALFYYNAIIDLSWALLYISIPYISYQTGQRRESSTDWHDFTSAKELLDELLKNVKSPIDRESTDCYNYNKYFLEHGCDPNKMNEFNGIINLVTEFWKNMNSDQKKPTPVQAKMRKIRDQYNYCKHRGALIYRNGESNIREASFYSFNEREWNRLVSSHQDVQKLVDLDECIDDLYWFDDEILFPYLEKLITSLENHIIISPFVS